MSAPGSSPHTRARIGAVALAIAVAACSWGTRPKSFAPARGPAGAAVRVHIQGESADRRGELFAADSTGIIVRATRLTYVAWPRVRSMHVAQTSLDYDVSRGITLDAAHRARLTLVSRFPQGLTGPLLARVLATLGQDTLDVVR